jgi:hypothetical protein
VSFVTKAVKRKSSNTIVGYFETTDSRPDEEELRKKEERPDEWIVTGRGYIIRFFLNEVSIMYEREY